MTQEQNSCLAFFHSVRAIYQAKGKSLVKAQKEACKAVLELYGEEKLEELFKDEIEAQ
jgi:hypothetical protein